MNVLNSFTECLPLILSSVLDGVDNGFDWEASRIHPFLASNKLGQYGLEDGLFVGGRDLDLWGPAGDEGEPTGHDCVVVVEYVGMGLVGRALAR